MAHDHHSCKSTFEELTKNLVSQHCIKVYVTPKMYYCVNVSSKAHSCQEKVCCILKWLLKKKKKKPAIQSHNEHQYASHTSSLWNSCLRSKLLRQSPHTDVTGDMSPGVISGFAGSGAVIGRSRDDITYVRGSRGSRHATEETARASCFLSAHAPMKVKLGWPQQPFCSVLLWSLHFKA